MDRGSVALPLPASTTTLSPSIEALLTSMLLRTVRLLLLSVLLALETDTTSISLMVVVTPRVFVASVTSPKVLRKKAPLTFTWASVPSVLR